MTFHEIIILQGQKSIITRTKEYDTEEYYRSL